MISPRISKPLLLVPGATALAVKLLDVANERGGADNITAVLARFVESSPEIEDFAKEEIPVTTSGTQTIKFVT